MNNEPVGVVCEFEGILVGTLFEQLPDGTPLYTHPAKTLTDEEINDLIVNKVTDADMIRQALRKAQEK